MKNNSHLKYCRRKEIKPSIFQSHACFREKSTTTTDNAPKIAQWTTPKCGRLQPATDNGLRDGRSNSLAFILHPLMGGDISD